MVNSREIVLEMLLEILEKGSYSHLVVRNVLDKYDYLDARDKSFIKRLCEGTIEQKIRLEYCINQFSNVATNKMKPVIRVIILMGAYQILFMDSVPDSAACNESVKCAQKKGFQSLKGFVNGVLRTISRSKEKIVFPDKNKNKSLYLSVYYSMPEWIIKMWLKNYEEKIVQSMLEAFQKTTEVCIRFEENLSKETKEEALNKISNQGIIIKQHPYLSYAFLCESTEGIRNIPGFSDGFFTVQDVSSMLVAEVANVQKGNVIMDICAAPGGKTMHLASKLSGTGMVLSRDLTQNKVDQIQENLERMKYENVKTMVSDATVFTSENIEIADILVADVPCSGLGIIGKKRDIKYHASPEKILELIELQKKIIQTVWQYVKPGGVLLYSTCTINPDENEKMIEWIQEKFPFIEEGIEEFIPKELSCKTTKEGHLQLFPGIHQTDGFFMARLRRKMQD